MKKLITSLILVFIAVATFASNAGAATPTTALKTWYENTGTARIHLFLKDTKAIKVAEKSQDNSKLHKACKKLRVDSNPYGALNKHPYYPDNTILDTEWVETVVNFNVASVSCGDSLFGVSTDKELNKAKKTAAHYVSNFVTQTP